MLHLLIGICLMSTIFFIQVISSVQTAFPFSAFHKKSEYCLPQFSHIF